VKAVAFSLHSKLLAAGSLDGTVRLWDASIDGRLAASTSRTSHRDWTTAMALSLEAKLVASASTSDYGNKVRLWDASTGTERALEGHSGTVSALAFSPDGRLVASGSNDNTVWLWDTSTGAERRALKGHSESVLTVAFSPDGRLVASGSNDNTVRLWDASTGAERRVLKGHSKSVPVLTVAFSPDGRLVASGYDDSTVRLWNASTGIKCHTLKRSYGSRSAPVYAVAFSPDSRLVAFLDAIWDASTGIRRHFLKRDSYWYWVSGVAFSPDGKLVATISEYHIALWDAATGTQRCTFATPDAFQISYFSFSSCGTYLITHRGSVKLPPRVSEPLHQIYASETWIRDSEDKEDLLFVPPDCQGLLQFVSGNSVVFSDDSGRTSVLQLSSSVKCMAEGSI
jgi:WD40 repeat protein